jgi:hypothetical protein
MNERVCLLALPLNPNIAKSVPNICSPIMTLYLYKMKERERKREREGEKLAQAEDLHWKMRGGVHVCIRYLAGTAFHSSQNVIKDDVTRMMPGMKTVVK